MGGGEEEVRLREGDWEAVGGYTADWRNWGSMGDSAFMELPGVIGLYVTISISQCAKQRIFSTGYRRGPWTFYLLMPWGTTTISDEYSHPEFRRHSFHQTS